MRFRPVGDSRVEARSGIGNFDRELVIGPYHRDSRRGVVSVTPRVRQCLLDDAIEGDLRGQRRLRRKFAQRKLGYQAGSSLMPAHDMIERLGYGQRPEMRQEQTARGRANVFERPPQAILDDVQLTLNIGFHWVVAFVTSRQSGHVVESQEGEANLLGGTVVQFSAEPAEES